MGDFGECMEDIISEMINQETAYEVFDRLEGVSIEFMIGKWKGYELHTGHAMEGLLSIVPWFGKMFVSSEEVIPLLFEDKRGRTYAINPRRLFKLSDVPVLFVPVKLYAKLVMKGKISCNSHMFDWAYKFLNSKKTDARLRQIVYRKKLSAAMIYDELGIIDVFRKVDENTVVGLMDFKGKWGKQGYFFYLKRC